MGLIKVNRKSALDDIENYYGQLARFAELDGSVDILLPKELDNNFIGLVPSLIQFLITWIRYEHAGTIWLEIEDPEKENFVEILERNELLFPAFILSWSRPGFYNVSGEINIKHRLRQPLFQLRDEMLKVRPQKGRKLLLASIDHFPHSSGSLPAFEDAEGFIDNEGNTLSNLKPALENILSLNYNSKQEFWKSGASFMTIIHELFKNTFEWARTDENNVALTPSIRGIFLKFNRKQRNTYTSEYLTPKGLRDFFESQVHIENGNKELYFLEISVFDSGIGFVNKFVSEDKEALSDIDIIKRCLMRHMTSDRDLGKGDKGIGLDEILQTIDKKGFIRIKTNRRCIYRNMITHPYKKVETEKDMDMFDWKSGSPNKFTEQYDVAGATITILFPLSPNLSI